LNKNSKLGGKKTEEGDFVLLQGGVLQQKEGKRRE